MRLCIDLNRPNCVAAYAAAIQNGQVQIIKSGAQKSNEGVILQTDRGMLRSSNAIVCFLLGADPLSKDLASNLIWESSVLKPALSQVTLDNLGDIRNILDELQTKIQDPNKKSSGQLNTNVFELIIWGDLFPFFSTQTFEYGFLNDFFIKMQIQPYCTEASSKISKHVLISNSRSAPKTKVGTKNPQKKEHEAKMKQVKVKDEGETLPIMEIEVSTSQMLEAQWQFCGTHDDSSISKVLSQTGVKLPLKIGKGVRNILITSALPYVNNVPHLGNLIGSLLSANMFALYCELAGYNTLAICGTDEYGTATETKAQAEGLTPREITDKYSALHRQVYDWFDIHFDYFGRTSTTKHTEITQELFGQLHSNGFITENSVEQLFCGKCSRALADRLVEGNCPFCKAEEARGDQCDACGKLINAIELIEPKCKACGTSPHIQSSQHLFLDLPKLEKRVDAFINQRLEDPEANWSGVAQSIARTWLRDGLKQRCITRDLKWGVPVPLKEFSNKVFYVWFDAPIGYMSITANYTPDWREWWQPKPDTAPIEYFQFMAKDNVPFHAAIFPATLLGVDNGYTMVKNLIATDYLNYEGQKFSKSRNIGIFGDNAKDTGIESNIWRFYLAYIRPESQDSSFSWDDFATKNNSELLNNLGNFINRPLTFLFKFFASTIPSMINLQPEDVTFLARVNGNLRDYLAHMEKCQLRDGLRSILSISRLGNGYMQATTPWVLFKSAETVERAGVVIGVACNIACLVGLLLRPFMPSVSEEIFTQCNTPTECRSLKPFVANGGKTTCLLRVGHVIGVPKPLFKKIEQADVQRFQKMYSCI